MNHPALECHSETTLELIPSTPQVSLVDPSSYRSRHAVEFAARSVRRLTDERRIVPRFVVRTNPSRVHVMERRTEIDRVVLVQYRSVQPRVHAFARSSRRETASASEQDCKRCERVNVGIVDRQAFDPDVDVREFEFGLSSKSCHLYTGRCGREVLERSRVERDGVALAEEAAEVENDCAEVDEGNEVDAVADADDLSVEDGSIWLNQSVVLRVRRGDHCSTPAAATTSRSGLYHIERYSLIVSVVICSRRSSGHRRGFPSGCRDRPSRAATRQDHFRFVLDLAHLPECSFALDLEFFARDDRVQDRVGQDREDVRKRVGVGRGLVHDRLARRGRQELTPELFNLARHLVCGTIPGALEQEFPEAAVRR